MRPDAKLPPRTDLPSGTVTFLFTDIDGSTRLLQALGDRYAGVLAEHRQVLRKAFEERDGREVDTQGDAFFAAFPRARDALTAAVAAQRGVHEHAWPDGVEVLVRMGLHTGEPLRTDYGYVGIDIHRGARLCAAAHGGQILLSQTTRDLIGDDLPADIALRDLGEHRLKDLSSAQRLFQVVAADLPDAFPPVRSLGIVPHNLPAQLTSFIGRGREMAEARALLEKARLVTLTGAGGAGKTRLALQLAAELIEGFVDGVWFVELAPIADPALVPQAVASALSVREQPGRPVTTTLAGSLRAKSLLLVLDNCEHLLDASAALMTALLRACPDLRILATSRESLDVPGEAVYRVPSLSVPHPTALPSPDRIAEHEAVALFIDRAAFAAPGFFLHERNVGAVAEVCRRLDGIPLAIELAAARVKAMSVDRLAERLQDSFRLLTGGRAALPRHQTLRAVMDWSYSLLADRERAMLRRLSVFAGGFRLEAAESVCAAPPIEAGEILDLLGHLVDKSLVVFLDRDGGERYRLLETVRQYAAEKILDAGEEDGTRMRHREYFLMLAKAGLPSTGYLGRGDRVAGMSVLEEEHDNLRAALEWNRQMMERFPGKEEWLRLGAALGDFWEGHSHLSEGRDHLVRLLDQSKGMESSTRGWCLFWAGRLALFQVDYPASQTLLEESAALFRRLRDKHGLAAALNSLGWVFLNRSDFSSARALYEESLVLRRALGDEGRVAACLVNLGTVARCEGDYPRARSLFQQAFSIFDSREIENAYYLASWGTAEYCAGDLSRGRAMIVESIALFARSGNKRSLAEALMALGGVTQANGNPERAAMLYGAAQALYEEVAASPWAYNQSIFDQDLAAVRSALGEEPFQAAWRRGRTMSLDDVLKYAV